MSNKRRKRALAQAREQGLPASSVASQPVALPVNVRRAAVINREQQERLERQRQGAEERALLRRQAAMRDQRRPPDAINVSRESIRQHAPATDLRFVHGRPGTGICPYCESELEPDEECGCDEMPKTTSYDGHVSGGQAQDIPQTYWRLLEKRQGMRPYLLGRLMDIQESMKRHKDAIDQVAVYRFVLQAIDEAHEEWRPSSYLPDGILPAAAVKFACSETTIHRAIAWCEEHLAAMSLSFS